MGSHGLQRLYLSATIPLHNENGQALVEYGITITLIVIVIMAGSAILAGLESDQMQYSIDILSKL